MNEDGIDPRSIKISYSNRTHYHRYYFYPEKNVYFCNIPKCASSAINEFILNELEPQQEELYFTVIRHPFERLKSALWMYNIQDSPLGISMCPHCGHKIGRITDLNTIVKDIKGIAEMEGPDINWHVHVIPQTQIIRHSPIIGLELKVFRMDQIDTIFNKPVAKKNERQVYGEDEGYIEFSKMFDEDLIHYEPFLRSYYKDDFDMWEQAQ